MSPKLVLNYVLSDDYYNINHSTPMAAQRSTGSTNSSWSHSSAASYHTYPSFEHHGNAKYITSTHGTSQHLSHNASRSQTSNSQYRGHPPSPSGNSDGDSKDPQYCPHEDCLDPTGQPKRSFSRKADVVRHIKSTHMKEFIDCPWPKCQRKGDNGFTRMDHLNEHRRGYHGESIAKRTNSHDASERHR